MLRNYFKIRYSYSMKGLTPFIFYLFTNIEDNNHGIAGRREELDR